MLALVPDRPVSFEVFADDFATMEGQAREIASWGSNVYVKIPVTNTKGEFSGPLLTRLSAAGRQAQRDRSDDQRPGQAHCGLPCRARACDRLGICRADCRYRSRSRAADARGADAARETGPRPNCFGRARGNCSISFKPMLSAATSSLSPPISSKSCRWSARISIGIRSTLSRCSIRTRRTPRSLSQLGPSGLRSKKLPAAGVQRLCRAW